MRKWLSLIIAVCLVFSMSSVALASDLISIHAPDLNDTSRLDELEQLKLRIEEAGCNETVSSSGQQTRIAYPIIEGRRLNVPLHQQATNYYCGPACGKMVIDYVQPQSLTQATVAQTMGTNSNGTYVYRLTDGLNHYITGDPYNYVQISELSFVVGMMHSIDNDYPVVCHVMTGALPVYNGHNTGHYVVTTGYYFAQYSAIASDNERTIYYNDPHFNPQYYGDHTCTDAQMINAINNNAGFYIMGG